MKLSEIPENYRKAQNIEDFAVGDIIYYFINSEYYKTAVDYVGNTYLIINNKTVKSLEFSFYKIHVRDKDKEPKHNFKVNDRVLLVEKGEFKRRVKITGTILDVQNQYIAVKWDDIAAEDVMSYSRDQWKHIEVINKEPKATKEITLDLKLNINLNTTRLETVLVDCVKALVSNGKYQEAKEVCELLLSVQDLGKAQNAPLDEPKDGSTKGA